MPEYYFDMETTGFDPLEDEIITIQYQRLSEPKGELQILKEWESSEEKILGDFLPQLKTENPFDFILVGNNLLFDFMFISYRAESHHLGSFDIKHFHDRVVLDIKPILVMINEGQFRGYQKLLGKPEADVPQLYKDKKYQEIVVYIENEADTFIRGYEILKSKMPSLKNYLRVNNQH